MTEVEEKVREATTELAERVETLEREMAELKSSLGEAVTNEQPSTVRSKDWRRTVGAFKDDPTFDEAVTLGQAWRRRQRKW